MSAQSRISASAAQLDPAIDRIDVAGIHRSTRQDILPKYPRGLRAHLKAAYLRKANDRPPGLPGWSREPWMRADVQLRKQDRVLRQGSFGPSFDADDLRLKARSCANIAACLMRGRDAESGLKAASTYARERGIDPPEPDEPNRTVDGCRRRLASPRWWRRRLKKVVYQRSEAIERVLGLVQATQGLYASDDAVSRRIQEKARFREFLSACLAVNDLGECVTLAEIAESNISNPRIRRAEFMARLRGCEEYANLNRHEAAFITLTVPSRFHAYRKSGIRNLKADSSTPADAQKWLCEVWARIRASLDRQGIAIYGFRIAEPHHDGTPHWHMVLFFEVHHYQPLMQTFERYMLADSPNEPGADQHRLKIVTIDRGKGSAAGYVAKYVSKNIDGDSATTDFEDSSASRSTRETVIRTEAWASLWGIRQFQQIGGPPVTVWRELRRLGFPLFGKFEEAREAADRGDWCTFMAAMGGHQARRQNQSIRVLRTWSPEPGLYGDPLGPIIVGVDCDGEPITTRTREWIIMPIPEAVPSRTCVNNCTPMAIDESSLELESRARVINSPDPPIASRPSSFTNTAFIHSGRSIAPGSSFFTDRYRPRLCENAK